MPVFPLSVSDAIIDYFISVSTDKATPSNETKKRI